MLEITFQQILKLVIDNFGATAGDDLERLETIFYHAAFDYHPAPWIASFLEDVRSAGLKAGVISNSTNSGALIEREIEKAGLGTYFGKIMSSADYGIRKQHPMLCETALSALSAEPGEAVFIGDHLMYDIQTAQTAGLATAWYNRKAIENETNVKPDYEFHDWAALNVQYLANVLR